MKLLENKIAFVSGASRGIGKGIAINLAKHGAHVAFTYRNSQLEAEAIEKELQTLGVKAKAYQSNAADFAQTQTIIEDVITTFGGLDIVVNNAGITKDNLLMRMNEEDRKSTRLNSSHIQKSRMPSSA